MEKQGYIKQVILRFKGTRPGMPGLKSKWVYYKKKLISFEYLALLVFFLMLFVFFGGRQGVIALIQIKGEKERLKKELILLKTKNQVMQNRIGSFQNGYFESERILREHLGMAKSDEIIYKFVQTPVNQRK